MTVAVTKWMLTTMLLIQKILNLAKRKNMMTMMVMADDYGGDGNDDDDDDDAPSFLPSPSLAAHCAEFVPVSLA